MKYKRKFLINQDIDVSKYKKKYIEQGFINNDGLSIKALDNKRFYLIKKTNDFKTKMEIKKVLYNRMITSFSINIISKNRYYISLNNNTAKYDVYEKELKGLKIVTIDFKTYNEFLKFKTPDWFGEEISKSSLYQNYNLANLYYDQINNTPKKKVK